MTKPDVRERGDSWPVIAARLHLEPEIARRCHRRRAALQDDLFVRDLKGSAAYADRLPERRLGRLRAGVEAVPVPVDDRWPEISGPAHAHHIAWAWTAPDPPGRVTPGRGMRGIPPDGDAF